MFDFLFYLPHLFTDRCIFWHLTWLYFGKFLQILINSLVLTSVISNLMFSSSLLLFSMIVVFIKFYLALFQIYLFFSLLSCFTVLFLNSFIILFIFCNHIQRLLLPESLGSYIFYLALQLSFRILYFFVWLILFIERLFSTGGICLVLWCWSVLIFTESPWCPAL